MKKLVLLLAVLPAIMFASPVHAQSKRTAYRSLGPLTNCNAFATNTTVTCGGTDGVVMSGYNGITLIFDYIDGGAGAGTGFTCNLEFYDNKVAKWMRLPTQQVASGTITLTASNITNAADATVVFPYSVGANYDKFRLAGCTGTGAPAGADTLSVHARLTFTPWL